MSAIASLFNYTIDVLGRSEEADVIITNDEWNHPEETVLSPVVLATTRGAVQERSAREQASLINVGAVRSTHRVYMISPLDGSGGPVVVDESRTLHVDELDMDLTIIAVRDGGGREDHLEIDAVEYRP
jgi:hypothetical protein